MLAGGCMLPSATEPAPRRSEGKDDSEDHGDEEDDEEDDDDDDDEGDDEHQEHPRTFASASSEMVVLPSPPAVAAKPAGASPSAAYPSATALAMAGPVPSRDLLRKHEG